MLTFRTTLAIVRAHFSSFVIYLLLPILMTVLFMGFSQPVDAERYVAHNLKIAIENEDGGPLSQALVQYLSQGNTLRALPGERQALRDALFNGRLDYALRIPANYFALLLDAPAEEAEPSLQSQLAPDQAGLDAVDRRIDVFVQNVRRFHQLDPALSQSSLAQLLTGVLAPEATIIMLEGKETSQDGDPLTFFFRFLAYSLQSLIFGLLSLVLRAFQQGRIDERRRLAPRSLQRQTLSLFASVLFLCLLTFLLLLASGSPFFPGRLFTAAGRLLFFNALVYLLPITGLGFLLSGLFRTQSNASEGANVVTSLVLAFLSGIFVPLAFIPPAVQTVARFTPTYWYNTAILELERLGPDHPTITAVFVRHAWIQLAFAAIFFAAFLLLTRTRRQTQTLTAGKPV